MYNRMVISKLLLNPISVDVQNDLSDLYCLHNRLKMSFASQAIREKISMLFRIDFASTPLASGIPIIIQSLVFPDWKKFDNQRNYLLAEPFTKEINNFDITKDFTYRFLLNASPSYLSKDKKIICLHRNDQLLQWIVDEGEKNGFMVEKDEINIKQLQPMIAIKKKAEGESKITVNLVEYSGLLHVFNKYKLTNAIFNGIGRGKDFGCGLLSIAS